MTEKNIKKQNADNEKSDTATGEKPAIPNPFEDGISQLTPEQEENIEQFKEAQTERD